MKTDNKRAIDAVQFLRLRARGGMVLVHTKGVNLVRFCKANRIPFRVANGLYIEADSELLRSTQNCVALKREHLSRLKKAMRQRIRSRKLELGGRKNEP